MNKEDTTLFLHQSYLFLEEELSTTHHQGCPVEKD